MIKKALKVAVCVAAVVSAPAFAQSPAAVSALQETAAGKQFIQQVLKLKPTATTVEVLNKINSLPAQESGAIVSAISIFNQGMKAKTGTVAQRSQANKANAELAAQIFTQNNQAIELAALTKKYASNVNVDGAVAAKAAQCSSMLDASKMVAGTRISFATADGLIKKGIIRRGKCNENPEEMESTVSKENLLEMGDFADRNNALGKTGNARLAIYAQGLIEAQANDNAANPIKDLDTAEQAVARVGDKCDWVPVSSKDLNKAL